MALLRTAVANTLRVSRTTAARTTPVLRRWETQGHNPAKEAGGQEGRPAPSTSEPPGAKASNQGGSGLIEKQEGPAEGQPRHNPDYSVAADYRTS